MFNRGKEQDYYPCETEEIIVDVLSKYIDDHPAELRRCDVLRSFINANILHNGKAQARRERIQKLLRQYKTLDAATQRELERFGINVIIGKKHYKMRLFGDVRYQINASKTGSDCRGGANMAHSINKVMF